MIIRRLIPLLVLLFLSAPTVGKHAAGVLATTDDFEYLERFCFLSEIGNLEFELSYPKLMYDMDGAQSLALYFDTDSQWKSAYKTNTTCQEKLDLLDPLNNQIIRLDYRSENFDRTIMCRLEMRGGEEWVVCKGNRRFISVRARWWYLAITNCDNRSSGVFIEYDLTMTNGNADDIWFYQFSADEFYILPVDVAFLILETFVLVTACGIAHTLRCRQMLHQTFKLFMHAVVMEIASLVCMVISYGKYSRDGIGFPLIKLIGQQFRAACTTTFILMLLLIAKGYTITRGRLSSVAAWKLTALILIYIILYMAMFIWQMKVFDPALVTFVSESVPGYCIEGLRLLSWASYCISSAFTCKKYPKKRQFYLLLGVAMTLWFWMGPITLYLANYLLDDWVREEVVNVVDASVVLYGFVVFTVLTWPSLSNRNFPFHVRTTRVGDVSLPSDFPQNAYEVQEEPSTKSAKDAEEKRVERPSDDDMTY